MMILGLKITLANEFLFQLSNSSELVIEFNQSLI